MTQAVWRELLSDWKRRISIYQNAQYENGNSLEKRHFRLGIPATAFAAIAGTTVFANIGKDFSTAARVTVASISIITAVLTAMQTFLNYGTRAEAHRAISHQFGTLRRDIDIVEQFPPNSEKEMQETLSNLNTRIGEITKEAPLIEARLTGSDSRSYGVTTVLPKIAVKL